MKPFPGPGAARLISTNGGSAPRFSPDGKQLLFGEDNKLMAVDVVASGPAGEPRLVFAMAERIMSIQVVGDRYLLQLQNEADASPPIRIIAGWRPHS
jgi:hypothetical protein